MPFVPIHKHRNYGVPVTIEVTVHPPYLGPIAEWASLQRTLNQAVELLGKYFETFPQDSDEAETIDACMAELQDFGPAMTHCHQQMQHKLWTVLDADKIAAEAATKRFVATGSTAQEE